MKSLIGAILIGVTLSSSTALAGGNVTYSMVPGRNGHYLISGDGSDNTVVLENTILPDGRTKGLLLSGGGSTTINGQVSVMLTATQDLRFELGEGSDKLIVADVDIPFQRISVNAGYDDDLDSFFIYRTRCENISLQWADKVKIEDVKVVQDLSINKYVGTFSYMHLDLLIADSRVHSQLTIDGTGKNDLAKIRDSQFDGDTAMDFDAGHDILEMSGVLFAKMTADFGRGDDYLRCTGQVICAAGSSVLGGSEGRRNRRAIADNDSLFISGPVAVYLGSASGWTNSNY
ncbi:MAG: hypothetical protein AB8G99_04820 [Planctomycetaceae bacterium]